MVLEGWALTYRHYSTDYADAEQAARAVPEGMWKGSFIEPWRWHRGKRLSTRAANDSWPPAAADAAITACQIKGNVNSSGERIYQVPVGQHYDEAWIDASKEELMF